MAAIGKGCWTRCRWPKVPRLLDPSRIFHIAPISWLLLIGTVLTGVGSEAFRRRDLRQGLIRRCAHSEQPRHGVLDSSSELVDIGCGVVVGGDAEDEFVGVADNRNARS